MKLAWVHIRNLVITASFICTLCSFLVAAGMPYAVAAMPGGVGVGFYLAALYLWAVEAW